jgi:acetylornithine deacetylase/succinyl-diaminopimelate desuccinylase-like protein
LTIQGGITPNVVPESLSATFDIRISPREDLVVFENRLKEWTNYPGVSYEFINRWDSGYTEREGNAWYDAIVSAAKEMCVKPERGMNLLGKKQEA